MSPTWGMSQRLPRRVGILRAKDLMFTGRTVGGQEAASIGLAHRCVADDQFDAALADTAAAIVANSWFTLRTDKALVRAGLDRSLTEGLRYERENSPGAGPDMMERLQGFGKKG
jgi:enoyl-CoA hydratase/carnithine racemase